MDEKNPLCDPYGRTFPYLRLSLTDMCNYRCTYCLPDGYKKEGQPSFLTLSEIQRLVRGFAGLGTWKIRLTGGEPTIRDDFLDIAKKVAFTAGIRKVSLTTNGYKLPDRAQAYKDAGISAINISIDSLRPERFAQITGHDRLHEALAGVDACHKAGLQTIKINAVLLKETASTEMEAFLNFAKHNHVSLRFIELMRTQDNIAFFKENYTQGSSLTEQLIENGWQVLPRVEGAGPAVELAHRDYTGTIGVIAPYAKNFCDTCNRLRVSAKGDLHLCLFGQGGTSLRDFLQADEQIGALQSRIRHLLQFKKTGHFLHDSNSGTTKHLASIGG